MSPKRKNRGVGDGQHGRWHRFDRLLGAGPTFAHFNGVDDFGYFVGPICGYDPHRGLKRPSAVAQLEEDSGPRCSRCERRLQAVPA